MFRVMNIDFITKRAQLLNKMAAIQTMELGSLLSEMRENSSGQPAGPYFKYQVWQDGRNISRRVPSEQAHSLQEAINNRQRFESLAKEFVDLTVAHTREMKPDAGSKKKTQPLSLSSRRTGKPSRLYPVSWRDCPMVTRFNNWNPRCVRSFTNQAR